MGRLFSFTYPTAAVLLAIVHGHRYGFDVMDATGLPDGTVYPMLRHRWGAGLMEVPRALSMHCGRGNKR